MMHMTRKKSNARGGGGCMSEGKCYKVERDQGAVEKGWRPRVCLNENNREWVDM